MTRASPAATVLLAIAFLASADASAEPRGTPTVPERPVKQIPNIRLEQPRGYVPPITRSEALQMQRDRALEEVLDDATRAAKLAELKIWIKRIPGRFRIAGQVSNLRSKGKIRGFADCASVGEGFGVQCIFNASWPVIDMPPYEFEQLMNGPIPRPPPSNALRAFHPALMVLGLDPALAEAQAVMVTDDSLAHTWAGRLRVNTLRANRLTGCRDLPPDDPPDYRCFQPLEITAEPESEIVTIVLRSAGVTITLAMHRDPDAQPLSRQVHWALPRHAPRQTGLAQLGGPRRPGPCPAAAAVRHASANAANPWPPSATCSSLLHPARHIMLDSSAAHKLQSIYASLSRNQ
jgi:hypothetical protein